MVKFCVFYYGKPEDPAAFDAYYRDHHLPLVVGWPKIRRIVLSKGLADSDLYQMAELYFDNRTEMEAALASPERAIAAEDGKTKLPRFIGEIKRQSFEVLEFAKG
jgi:uncharacterized protein (TIGR02118 family)